MLGAILMSVVMMSVIIRYAIILDVNTVHGIMVHQAERHFAESRDAKIFKLFTEIFRFVRHR
jgi:hypothetical protein